MHSADIADASVLFVYALGQALQLTQPDFQVSDILHIYIQMISLQTVVHYSLHLIAPALIAWIFFRANWRVVYIIFLLTMLIDLDHLFTTPIFDPHRCSIGFHPLHSFFAMPVYAVMLFIRKYHLRTIAIGILFHLFTDAVDCFWTFKGCESCYLNSEIYKVFSALGLN